MPELTGQLLLAIGALTGTIAFLFKLLSQQWNDRLAYVEKQLAFCQAQTVKATEQTDRVANLAERRQIIAHEEHVSQRDHA